MSEWCTTNGISKSTFAGWIRSKNDDVTKPKRKARFVEVTLSAELQEQPEPQSKNIIKYKSFKITIPYNIDVRKLEDILNVVLQANI